MIAVALTTEITSGNIQTRFFATFPIHALNSDAVCQMAWLGLVFLPPYTTAPLFEPTSRQGPLKDALPTELQRRGISVERLLIRLSSRWSFISRLNRAPARSGSQPSTKTSPRRRRSRKSGSGRQTTTTTTMKTISRYLRWSRLLKVATTHGGDNSINLCWLSLFRSRQDSLASVFFIHITVRVTNFLVGPV